MSDINGSYSDAFPGSVRVEFKVTKKAVSIFIRGLQRLSFPEKCPQDFQSILLNLFICSMGKALLLRSDEVSSILHLYGVQENKLLGVEIEADEDGDDKPVSNSHHQEITFDAVQSFHQCQQDVFNHGIAHHPPGGQVMELFHRETTSAVLNKPNQDRIKSASDKSFCSWTESDATGLSVQEEDLSESGQQQSVVGNGIVPFEGIQHNYLLTGPSAEEIHNYSSPLPKNFLTVDLKEEIYDSMSNAFQDGSDEASNSSSSLSKSKESRKTGNRFCSYCAKEFCRTDALRKHLFRMHRFVMPSRKVKEHSAPLEDSEHGEIGTPEEPHSYTQLEGDKMTEKSLPNASSGSGSSPVPSSEKTKVRKRMSKPHWMRCHACTLCGKEFSRSFALNDHLTLAHGVNGFQRGRKLHRHMRRQLMSGMANSEDSLSAAQSKSKESRRTGNRLCYECGKEFCRTDALKKHLTNVHGIGQKKEENYICQICGRIFRHQTSRDHHQRTHDGASYVCETCGKAFTSRNRLKGHAVTHEGIEYPCSICNKVFLAQHLLASHTKFNHDSINRKKTPPCRMPCVCTICGETYSTKYSLQTHFDRCHPAHGKPYNCETCKKGYNSAEDLHRHMKRHTAERPFWCDQCPAKFFRKDILKKHRNTHARVPARKCIACDKSFLWTGSYYSHIRSVHPEMVPQLTSLKQSLESALECPPEAELSFLDDSMILQQESENSPILKSDVE